MNQQNLLNFDNHDFDLNSLFMFSFEQFKLLITSLAKNQKHSLQRINDIEDKITFREKKIEDLEKQLKKQENFMATKFKNITNIAVNNASNKGDSVNDISHYSSNMNVIPNSYAIEAHASTNSITNFIARESSVDEERKNAGGDYINVRSIKLNEEEGKRKLLLKISQLERSITDLENKLANSSNSNQSSKQNEDQLNDSLKKMENLNSIIEEVKKNNDKLTEKFEEISIKVEDFNIYDLFKSNIAEGGSADASIILIQNLEKKLFKKFEFIDEKMRKTDEDSYRYKNELSNNKIQFENINKALNLLKEENEKHNKNGTLLKNIIEEKYNEMDAKLKDLNSQINDSILIQINQLKEMQREEVNKALEENKPQMNFSQQNQEEDAKSKQSGAPPVGMNEGELKLVKECIRKTMEFEKNFKVFVNQVNIDNIKSELAKMHEALNSKLNSSDISDVKDMLTQNTAQMNFLKDSISQLLEDRKMMDDINWLRKKVELLSSSMSVMQNAGHDSNQMHNLNSTNSKTFALDTSKFVDQLAFLEFQKSLFRELDNLKRFSEELRRYIDDLIESNKTKADGKDMRNLEEFLNSKVEETKLNFAKKFADKAETTKNIKYLDVQLKHIIDSYLKKGDKGDNWLIAKKPVGGYACASCESYIGKLQDSTNQHVPWNKYPQRDPNEKAYRIGNGYSRMLQMLSVDFKKNATNYPNLANSFNNESDDERSFSNTHNKKDLVLPSLKIQNPLNLNISADLIKTDDEMPEEKKMDHQKPKIVKIYKKPKTNQIKEMTTTDINNNLRVSTSTKNADINNNNK